MKSQMLQIVPSVNDKYGNRCDKIIQPLAVADNGVCSNDKDENRENAVIIIEPNAWLEILRYNISVKMDKESWRVSGNKNILTDVFVAKSGPALIISQDYKKIVKYKNAGKCVTSLHSMLKYGYVPYPYTVHASIYRICAGINLELVRDDARILTNGVRLIDRYGDDYEYYYRKILEEIRSTLLGINTDVQLLFSAGVDSSFLATMLREVGNMNVELIFHNLPGRQKEAENAKRIADNLGYPLNIVTMQTRDLETAIIEYSEIYDPMFSDSGALLMLSLIDAAVHSDVTVVDGTAADAVFGLRSIYQYYKWHQEIEVIRGLVNAGGNVLYSYMLSNNRIVSKIANAIVRYSNADPADVICPQNMFEGYLFMHDINSANRLNAYIASCYRWTDAESGLYACDLVKNCKGVYKNKSLYPIIRKRAYPCYPFLSDGLLDIAETAKYTVLHKSGRNKSILIDYLAKQHKNIDFERKKYGYAISPDVLNDKLARKYSSVRYNDGMRESISSMKVKEEQIINACLLNKSNALKNLLWSLYILKDSQI